MNAERLLAHYESIAEAPDAVPRLRQLILDLALRGKLVPQHPTDEPSSELLKRIANERARLGLNARPVSHLTPSVASGSMPFPLPASWAWTRFGLIADFSAGRTPPRNESAFWSTGDHAWVSIADMKAGAELTATKETVSNKARREIFKSDPAPPGTIIMSFKLTIGKIARLAIPAYHNEAIISIRCVLPDLEPFLFRVLPDLARGGQTKDAIKGATLNRDSIFCIPFPLPPLSEQHRIVAKIDELTALCDRLEAARKEREATRDRLTTATFARLNVPNSKTFRDDARFALDALPALTARANQVKALRQTIIDLAVTGRLVRQNPDDGSGAELLANLSQLQARATVHRGRRDGTSEVEVKDEEKYLQLPFSWTWTRLRQVGTTQTGTSPSSSNPDFFGDHIPFIKPADLDGGTINYDGPGLSEQGMRAARVAPANTVLMVCIGATLGKVNVTSRTICFNQQINSVTPFLEGTQRFLALALKASGFQQLAWRNAGTGTLPIISKGRWEVLPIPLPPLAEQLRIVARVDELIWLCERLEAGLSDANRSRTNLLSAILSASVGTARETTVQSPATARRGAVDHRATDATAG